VASLPTEREPPRPPRVPERGPEPEPEPEPEPDPVAEEPLEPTPPPPATDPDRIVQMHADEKVLTSPQWRAADTAYRTGLELYRSAFDTSVQRAAPTVRAALAQFRQAQDLLDALGQHMPEAADTYEVERRLVELNALVLDCTKRLGTD
jgi:hypothetical protein